MKKRKVHLSALKKINAMSRGQTRFEYTNQTQCGYVRGLVTTDESKVTCFFCINSLRKIK